MRIHYTTERQLIRFKMRLRRSLAGSFWYLQSTIRFRGSFICSEAQYQTLIHKEIMIQYCYVLGNL